MSTPPLLRPVTKGNSNRTLAILSSISGLLLALSSGGCGASHTPHARGALASDATPKSQATLAPPPPQPVPLGARRSRLVRVGQNALAWSLAEWGLSQTPEHCVLTFDATQQWLTGCSALTGSDGYQRTGETLHGEQVLWNAPSLQLGGRALSYEQVRLSVVGTVAPHKRDDGVADYVLVMQDWDALRGQHPGFVRSGAEEWLGIFVHEGFHAYQLTHPRAEALAALWEGEHPAATQDELATFFREHPDYQKAVKAEHELLRDALRGPVSVKGSKRALKRWLSLYAARRKRFESEIEQALPNKQAFRMDAFEMFLEGGARYVEARTLADAPDELFVELMDDPTYQGRASTRRKLPVDLPGLSGLGPRYFYSIGMYLCFLLDRSDPNWKQHVFDDEGLLLSQVERVARMP